MLENNKSKSNLKRTRELIRNIKNYNFHCFIEIDFNVMRQDNSYLLPAYQHENKSELKVFMTMNTGDIIFAASPTLEGLKEELKQSISRYYSVSFVSK